MKRHILYSGIVFFCLLMTTMFITGALADNDSTETLLYSAIQRSYPDCQIFDYAPIGQEKTEYIVLTLDSEEKAAVMIVDTAQPAARVEFRNDKILEGILPDKKTVQVMDHTLNGYPYIEYRSPDGPDFLYVVFRKNGDGRWQVNEAQFGDEWHDLYRLKYEDRDQRLHIYLTGNELMALSDNEICLIAENFDPTEARMRLRTELTPFLQNQKTMEYDKTAEECYNTAWLMTGAAFDDLLENMTDRINSRQMYAVTGTVKYVIPGTIQRAVFNIAGDWVPFSLLISNLSDTEWVEGSTYTIYAEAYAYSETERIPWLLAGYTHLK